MQAPNPGSASNVKDVSLNAPPGPLEHAHKYREKAAKLTGFQQSLVVDQWAAHIHAALATNYKRSESEKALVQAFEESGQGSYTALRATNLSRAHKVKLPARFQPN